MSRGRAQNATKIDHILLMGPSTTSTRPKPLRINRDGFEIKKKKLILLN
jgi:hypothetical protein